MKPAQPAGQGISGAAGADDDPTRTAQTSSLREVADVRQPAPLRHRPARQPARRSRVFDLGVVVVKFAILVTSGVVLLIYGAGDGSPIRCDLAAAAVCLMSSCVLGVIALILFCRRSGDELPWEDWEQLAFVFVDVNTLSFAVLALLAHALPVLLQLLTVAADVCWVLSCLSVSAWIWRRGVERPKTGELPMMLRLLRIPKMLVISFFVLCEGLAVGTLYFKPVDKLDLSTELGRLEHLLLTTLGSLYIVALLGIMYLFFTSSGRRLLVFEAGRPMSESPMSFHAFIKAVMVSGAATLYGAVFFAVVLFSIMVIIVLLMVRLSLHWSQPPVEKMKKKKKPPEGSAPGKGSGSSSSKVMPIMDELQDQLEDVSKEIISRVSLRKSKKKIQVKEPVTCAKRCKKCAVTSALVLFAFAKVALIFLAFVFDVVFIQQAVTPLKSRNFILVKEDATCGKQVKTFEDVDDAATCAIKVKPDGNNGVGFVFGSKNKSTVCYKMDIRIDQDMYDDLTNEKIACEDDDKDFTLVDGLDFYAVQPAQSCSIGPQGRRLTKASDAVGAEQVLETDVASPQYTTTEQLDEGIGGMLGKWAGTATEWAMKAMEWILSLKVDMPRDFMFQCRAPRRYFSASMVLGAILSVAALATLDVLSILAASKEISAVRAGEVDGFVNYLIMVARPQLLEMLCLTTLQISITSSVPFMLDAVAIFSDACGNLVRKEHFAGTNCPNIWHLPVDIAATAVLFLSFAFFIGLFIAVFAGLLYGLPPTQWAVQALFGRYLRLASFVAEERLTEPASDGSRTSFAMRSQCSTTENLTTLEDGKKGKSCPTILRPFMGLPVTLGMWSTCSSVGFQIGRRQEWYEPVDNAADGHAGQEADLSTNGELVSWKSIYSATSKTISLAWLPLPRGLIMSKAALYLNEYVIFTAGDDGGGSRSAPEPISKHFLGDTSQFVALLHWMSWAIQFAIILAVDFDLLGDPEDQERRLLSLQICLVVVVGIALLRVGLEMFKELLLFTRKKKVVGRCAEIVEDAEILVILDDDSQAHKDGLLFGICPEHHAKIVLACKELVTLEWVTRQPQPVLPSAQRSLLRSTKIQESARYQKLNNMLDEFARSPTDKLSNAIRGDLILVLHEAVDDEVQATRCQKVARQDCIAFCNDESQKKAQYLQRWAESQAKAEAVAEASERQKAYEDAVRRVEAIRQHGMEAEQPPDPVTKFQLFFTAAATSSAKVTGRWLGSGRDLLEKPMEVRSTVSVQGEIVLMWTKELRHDQLDRADVAVKSVSHRITIHNLSDHEKEELNAHDAENIAAGSKFVFSKHKSTHSYGTVGCPICEWDAKMQAKGHGCCSKGKGSDHHDLEAGKQTWQLARLGVEWKRDKDAVRRSSSRLGSPAAGSDGAEGGSCTHTRHYPEEPVAWTHSVSPAPTYTKAMQTAEQAQEALRKLEEAIAQGVGRDPQWLMGAFLNCLNADDSKLSAEDTAKRARLLAVASRMIRGSKSRPSQPAPVEHVEKVERETLETTDSAESAARDNPVEKLRAALARDPLDADELSLAIDVARTKDVDPLLLQQAEETFVKLVAKQKAALKLVEAIESRMIGNLKACLAEARDAGIIRGEFPDESSVGVIEKAEAILEEEKAKATQELEEALKANGALRLQRAIQQAEEVGGNEELLAAARHRLESIEEKKRRIALLKMSLATNDIELLRTAIEECEKEGLDDEKDKVDVNVAKQRLEEMERAAEKAAAEKAAAEAAEKAAVEKAKASQANKRYTKKSGGPLQQFRANAALRAALYSDPPQAVLLRLAITQARAAGVQGPDLERAEELVEREAEKEQVLGGLRSAAASHDIQNLGGAVEKCRELGVDSRKLLSAITQLIEDQAKVARSAGSHGIGNVVLADLERERRELHNQLQETHGAIRVLCRVRPFLPSELEAASEAGDNVNMVARATLRHSASHTNVANASVLRKAGTSRLSVAGSSTMAGARYMSQPRALTPSKGDRPTSPGILGRGYHPTPAVVRVDRHTLCVLGGPGINKENTFRTGSVFGADSIQAEVWNEVRSLVQSAVDGYNISLITCGPKSAGKTFTMLGGRAEGRGILPRLFDDLFAMRDRDSWRAEFEVEAQLVEIYDATRIFDLLSRGKTRTDAPLEAPKALHRSGSGSGLDRNLTTGFSPVKGLEARQAWVDSPHSTPRDLPAGSSSITLDKAPGAQLSSVMTRHVTDKLELQRLVEENWTNPVHPDRDRQVLLVLHLTRTNRATGVTTRSKIVCVDMASLGETVSPEVQEAHEALHVVLEAITERAREVPFDIHILTQVLQDCMGGNSKTVMLLCLSPTQSDTPHSLATLALAPVGVGTGAVSRASSKFGSRPPSRGGPQLRPSSALRLPPFR